MAYCLSVLAGIMSTPAQANDLRAALAAEMPGLTAIYRDLHRNPELAFGEARSARIMAEAARKAGFAVTERVGKTGVVAVMKNGAGPVVMIRADMDALPLAEQTGLPFASSARGVTAAGTESAVMHACGHDTHMTAWIAAARLLASRKGEWSGTLVMIAQPAEETGDGARAMLADGLYSRFPKPDTVLAFHDSATLPAGTIGYTPGYTMANVDSVDITVKGVGGHGASPHTTRDPIVLASAIVTRLQTLVSRESSPFDPSVVTVGSFRAGTTYNIIPDEAKLQLTVRSYSDASRKLLLDGIARIARGEAIAAGLPEDGLPDVKVEPDYTRATFNTPELTTRVAADLAERFGTARVRQVPPSTVGEDFSEYRLADPERVQSLLLWVGGVPQAKWDAAQRPGAAPLPSLHSPFWAPDAEAVIATGAEALTATAMRLMPKRAG
ncbi:amidohydrolase [Qipengyuania sediminis]|uniref:amidohydrolase n=1 Tax=Qipengyuania sediminis TaxID=1532023 RepID=UPI0010595ACE|nr:amidohydrolase [Qipengyuania sediminis]